MSGAFSTMALAAGNNYTAAIDSGTAGAESLQNTAVLLASDGGLVFAGQGSFQAFLQDSPDGVTFYDFRTLTPPLVFTALAAGQFGGGRVPRGVRRYIRLRYAVIGSNPTGTVTATLGSFTPDERYPFSFEVL